MEFLQVNLADATAAERVFRDDKGVYDYAFNLAGETKYGQSDEVCVYACCAVIACQCSVLSGCQICSIF